MQLVLTLMAIFACTFILLAFDLFTALIVTGLIAIIIIDMVGIMFLWNIELNAISLVNLVIVSYKNE
jgi:Niemann-Pick C1 protein